MASEAEGFICPYCLVGFATSGKLQSHFVDLHSETSEQEEEWEDTEDDEVSERLLLYSTHMASS